MQPNKNSVLDKFKLFNNKEKNQERGKASSGVSKRTSSSSGFSSARSEHSDSSTSLCDQSKGQQQACQESPKSRALKSKLQSATKSTKQASPKTGRKEQSKAQSKIARTKAPSSTDKLMAAAYNSPVSQEQSMDGRIPGKMSGSKLPADRKNCPNLQELVRQPPMAQPPLSQKTTNPTVLTASRQMNAQETRNAGAKNEPPAPATKLSPRPKMELPGRIPPQDLKIPPQNVKPPPNGFNKELMMHRAILANTNGIVKLSDPNEEMTPRSDENDGTLDRTLSMNQANLSSGRDRLDIRRKESDSGLLQVELDENDTCAPLKIREEEIDDDTEGRKEEVSLADHTADLLLLDDKSENADERAVSPRGNLAAQNTVSFGPGRPLQGPNSSPSGPALSPGSSIPKPTALVKGTSKPPKESCVAGVPTPTKPKCDAPHRKLDPNTVAMVSPMPSISDLMSESSHSNSNSTGQSNSSDSSVIYRPSSESGSEIKTIPNRKIDTTFERMEKVGLSVLQGFTLETEGANQTTAT